MLVTALAARGSSGRTRLHAGLFAAAGRRVLVAGAKGAGKTSFLLRLLEAGADVMCDENTLLRDRDVLPLPRRFHLRAGTLELLPALEDLVRGRRRYDFPGAEPFCFFDPTDAGRTWRIASGPVDTVVLLEPAFGGDSRLEDCPKVDMVRHLLFQTLDLPREAGPSIGELSRLVEHCACRRLHVGDLNQAARFFLA